MEAIHIPLEKGRGCTGSSSAVQSRFRNLACGQMRSAYSGEATPTTHYRSNITLSRLAGSGSSLSPRAEAKAKAALTRSILVLLLRLPSLLVAGISGLGHPPRHCTICCLPLAPHCCRRRRRLPSPVAASVFLPTQHHQRFASSFFGIRCCRKGARLRAARCWSLERSEKLRRQIDDGDFQHKPALIISKLQQMVIASSRIGKQMLKGESRANAWGAHGHFAAGELGEAVSKTMANRPRLQLCRKHRSSFNLCIFWKFTLLIGFLVVLFLGAKANAKGFQRNLDSFFCTVDQDGNGEIEQGEASKFLRKLDAQMADEGDMEIKEGMSELIASSQFDFNFSYGGSTISAEEMLHHLSNMMTANHVVDWVTHGLQLPQYAEAFRQNAINGMDFPALIEKDSEALLEDLGIKSTLHRTKITHALVRQIFGIGTVPDPLRSLQCSPSSYGGIQLSWEAPTNRGVPPLHKYLIERWSKTFSTWTNVADTREVAFLDTNAVKLGKEYTYRMQTWGGHGPSNWVTVDGCRADFTPSPSKMDVEDTLPLQMARQVGANLDPELLMPRGSKPSQEEESGMWTWINSGVILFLALVSRHTFFFDVTLAAWVLLKNHLRQALRQGLESPHLCVRTVARSISLTCESWSYMRHKVWTLSRLGVDPPLASRRATLKSLSEPCMKSPFEAEEELNGGFLEAQEIRSISADNLLESSGSGLQLSSGDSKGSSPNSSKREVVLEDVIDKAVVFPPSTSQRDVELLPVPSKRSKNRCNHENCKVRFDRWHSLQDWWMKLNKHYCRECQSVYCVKHTRISPHGPRGQCGLDSTCYCYNCYANLPSESQRRLEEQNKLRVGPSVTSDSSSSAATSLGSSKQRFGSSSNSSIAGAGLPLSLSDTMEPYLDGNGLLDFRDVVAAKSVGVSKAASESGMPDDSSERVISKRGHRKQRSFA